jgi:hypothetical protein
MQRSLLATLVALLAAWAFAGIAYAQLTGAPTDAYQISYASNLDQGDTLINVTNSGAGTIPGQLLPTGGNICVNVYAFAPGEQMLSCCACNVTPNALQSISTVNSLISDTLTGIKPTSLVITLLASSTSASTCDPTTPNTSNLVSGMLAWSSTIHQSNPYNLIPGLTNFNYATELQFTQSALSVGELNRMVGTCTFIIANGSGYGTCNSCQSGALGAANQ